MAPITSVGGDGSPADFRNCYNWLRSQPHLRQLYVVWRVAR
jgi:hypothetical protein